MIKTLQDLAETVGGEIEGDPGIEIEGISSLELAGPKDITFVTGSKHAHRMKASRAGAFIVSDRDLVRDLNGLIVKDPYLAYAKVAGFYHVVPKAPAGIAEGAFIHPDARIGEEVSIRPMVWVDRGAVIGDGTVLYPGVRVGENCRIGEDSVLHPNVVLYPNCRLGNRVIVHAGTVIGSDGFGYARDGNVSVKIPQMGGVRIDDDVEIGSNTTIDRASFGDTWIQRGVKIDNLVQIGHNTVVGEDTILISQVGLAGSAEIGRGAILAGQVGVIPHIRVGDGAIIGPQSGVAKDIPSGEFVSGSPSISHRKWLRCMQIVSRLPEYVKRIRALEKKLLPAERETHAERQNK